MILKGHSYSIFSLLNSPGHYYAYVRPDIDRNQWYRFDDDKVTKVDYKDVIADAFGGEKKRTEKHKKRGFLERMFGGGGRFGWGGRTSSAYMLQYVRRCDVSKLFKMQLAD